MRPRVLHSLFGLIVLLCLLVGYKHSYAYGEIQVQQRTRFCTTVTPVICSFNAVDLYEADVSRFMQEAICIAGSQPLKCTYTGSPSCAIEAGYGARCTGLKFERRYQNGNLHSSGNFTGNYPQSQAPACPDNANPVGVVCECKEGFKPEGSSCVPYDCPPGGSHTVITQPDIKTSSVSVTVCMGGCVVKPNSWKVGKDGSFYGSWPFTYSGKTCGGAKDSRGLDLSGTGGFQPAPIPCPTSQCPGSINGTNVCVPCSSATGPSTEKAPTPIPADAPGVDGVKGAQNKESSTQCDGTTCTTTTTYRDALGNKVGEKTQEKPKESFCQENPTLQICKDGKWGGTCAAGFTCDGDAIQCAMARKQHETACKLLEEPPSELVATVQSLKGTGQAEGAFNETFSASAGFSPMPVAGCAVQDFPVSIGPLNLTVPLGTLLCPHLGTIRSVLSAFGALYFVMVVFVRGD